MMDIFGRWFGWMNEKPSEAAAPVMADAKPTRVTKQTVVLSMRQLLAIPEFQLLRSLWLDRRSAILTEGKKDRKPEQWAVLDGFDQAVMEVEKWAALETKEDSANRQAKELLASLSNREA